MRARVSALVDMLRCRDGRCRIESAPSNTTLESLMLSLSKHEARGIGAASTGRILRQAQDEASTGLRHAASTGAG